MPERRDSGLEGYKKGGIQKSRTQNRRDAGQEEAGQEGIRKRGMQDMWWGGRTSSGLMISRYPYSSKKKILN